MPEFPDWAAERDAPGPHPLRSHYHWERAVVLLVGAGVDRRSWPAPYQMVGGALREVDERSRRQLARSCAELRCQSHVYFLAREVDDLIPETAKHVAVTEFYKVGNRYLPHTPRKFDTEEAIYVVATDAAVLLLMEDVVPSKWPDIYLREPGSKAEPEIASDKSHWVREVFCGQGEGIALMVEPAFHKVLREEYERSGRAASDAVNEFNRSVSADHQRWLREQELMREAARQPWERVTLMVDDPPATPEPVVRRADTALDQPGQPPSLQWHRDVQAILGRMGGRARANRVWEELCTMEGYSGSTDSLRTPDGAEITFKTFKNKLSELRPRRESRKSR